MRPGANTRFNNERAEPREWPNRVAYDFSLGEEVAKCPSFVLNLDDLVLDGVDSRNQVERLLNARLVAAGGNERNAEFAQVFAHEPTGVAGGSVHDDRFGGRHELLLSMHGLGSHTHPAIDRQANTGDKTGRVGGQEHHYVGHVGNLAEPTERRQTDNGSGRGFRARVEPECRHIYGELSAHLGGHEPRVNAVHSHAVAELARLHGCDAGEPVDGGLRCRVAGDARESDRCGYGRHVDHSATLARRTPWAHGPERVLDAECGTEDVDLEHPEDVLRVEVYDQFRDLDPGVVHHDVQAVEFGDRPCDRRLPARVIGHVQRDEPGGYS